MKIKGLNDSREVSAILYITTVITVAVFLVTFIFGDYINIDGGTYGLGISTATTFVLVLIFVPKVSKDCIMICHTVVCRLPILSNLAYECYDSHTLIPWHSYLLSPL